MLARNSEAPKLCNFLCLPFSLTQRALESSAFTLGSLANYTGNLMYHSVKYCIDSSERRKHELLRNGIYQTYLNGGSVQQATDRLIEHDKNVAVESTYSKYLHAIKNGFQRTDNEGFRLGFPELGLLQDALEKLPTVVSIDESDEDMQQVYDNFLYYAFGQRIEEEELKKLLLKIESGEVIHSSQETKIFCERSWIYKYENAKNSFYNLFEIHEEWQQMHTKLAQIQSYTSEILLKLNKHNLYRGVLLHNRRTTMSLVANMFYDPECSLSSDPGNSPNSVARFGKYAKKTHLPCLNPDESEAYDSFEDFISETQDIEPDAAASDYEEIFDFDSCSSTRQVGKLLEENNSQLMQTNRSIESNHLLGKDRIEDRSLSLNSGALINLTQHFSAMLNESTRILHTLFTLEAELITRVRLIQDSNTLRQHHVRNRYAENIQYDTTELEERDNVEYDEDIKTSVPQEVVDDVISLLFHIDLITRYVTEKLTMVRRQFDTRETKLKQITDCFLNN